MLHAASMLHVQAAAGVQCGGWTEHDLRKTVTDVFGDFGRAAAVDRMSDECDRMSDECEHIQGSGAQSHDKLVVASAVHATKLRVALAMGAAVAVYQIESGSTIKHTLEKMPTAASGLEPKPSVTALAWSADGQFLFIGRDNGAVERLEPSGFAFANGSATPALPWWPPEGGTARNGPISALSCVGTKLAAIFSDEDAPCAEYWRSRSGPVCAALLRVYFGVAVPSVR
jgi:hypothetical protein